MSSLNRFELLSDDNLEHEDSIIQEQTDESLPDPISMNDLISDNYFAVSDDDLCIDKENIQSIAKNEAPISSQIERIVKIWCKEKTSDRYHLATIRFYVYIVCSNFKRKLQKR